MFVKVYAINVFNQDYTVVKQNELIMVWYDFNFLAFKISVKTV